MSFKKGDVVEFHSCLTVENNGVIATVQKYAGGLDADVIPRMVPQKCGYKLDKPATIDIYKLKLRRDLMVPIAVGDLVKVCANRYGSSDWIGTEGKVTEASSPENCLITCTKEPDGMPGMLGTTLAFHVHDLAPLERATDGDFIADLLIAFKEVVEVNDNWITKKGGVFKEKYLNGPHEECRYQVPNGLFLADLVGNSAVKHFKWVPTQ